jgi:hypothetical protein
LQLFNVILHTGIIPDDWKFSTILPIPKPQKFEYNMANVRPIALLETICKVFTRIITSRLGSVFTTNKILREENFCGLKGDSTDTPIHLLNVLIEDAKLNNKELWIVLQDISKAFDSISLEGIQLALERIDMPSNIINFTSIHLLTTLTVKV